MNPFNDNVGTGAMPAPSSEEEVLVFPLSFAQQRLWVLDRLEPNSAFYNLAFARRLTGTLNFEALERSLNEIVQRHEVLRTTFAMRDEEPVQVVTPNLYLNVPVTDLSGLRHEDREPEARLVVNQEAQQPFDLARGPLLRARLIRLDSHEHVLVLNMHHIVSDGWSVGVLMHELMALYEAFTKGQSSPLPDLPIQYADFALWQREWLQGPVLEQQLGYWRSQLQGAPSLLDIPTDRPRPPVESFRGDSQVLRISSNLTEGLKALSRQQHATLFMTLLTAFDILLSRYSGQEDIVIGTPIANRNRPEIESLIGFFANTLALRCDLSGNPTFIELLGRSRETALGAYAHQDLPFERLVEELRPERSLSHNPLFQVIFALQNLPRSQQGMAGLKSQPFGAKVGTAKVDLALFFTEGPDGLMGTLEYSTDIFDATTIGRLVNHFQHLLEAIVENPARRISELPLLDENERRQLLVEWNNTSAELPSLCLHQLFEAQAEQAPDRIAVRFQDHSLSYRDLNRRANQLAHALEKMGVGRGERVGVYIERSLEMMIALLAVQKAGAAYVPLDPDYPAERVRLTLDDAQAPVIITQNHLLEALPEHSAQVFCLDSDWASIAAESAANPNSQVTPEDLIYVIFTSGSTGRPKGVQVPHRAVVNLLTSMRRELGVTEKDILVALASFAFDMCIPELYLPLIAGGTTVIGRREHAADGEALAGLLREVGASVVHATPTTWNLLLAAGYTGVGRKRVVGAEPLPRELCIRLLEADPSLYNFYGPTETTVWSTFHHFRSKDEPLTIGRPIANTQIYILDKYRIPVPVGVVGELYIGGDGVSCGYLNRPELNAEKFVPDVFTGKESSKLYRTGDLARYLPDGRIEFFGRADNQVKIRGFRIELGEIESVLAQHPAVQQAIAIVREDVLADKRLVAYLIPQKGNAPDANDLRTFAKTKLPDYMVPSRFVTMEQFPLTPNGKVDRKGLPAPDAARPAIEGTYIAPRTPVEEAVAGIWAEVLHLEQVGAHDEFFELGGHSLLATQVMSRIEKAFRVELPLRVLFESATVAGLARRINEARSTAEGLTAPPILPISRDRHLPLSFSQQRLWLLDQLQPGNPAYNLTQAIRLSGQLDLDALKRSLNEVVRRHEGLRTTVSVVNDQPIQIIGPTLQLDVPLLDFTHLPEAERESEARQVANRDAEKPFDLRTGPLFRATVVRLALDQHLLLLNMHHIVTDRWSLGVFSRDLAAIYRAFSEGMPSPLPELPIQYADFAFWQREWLQGEVLERQLGYWKTQLAAAPTLLELPTDRPRPPVETFRGAVSSHRLPPELLQKLKALSRREGVTLFMTLLAALKVLLWRYSGQDDILVGSPIANRNRTEVEDLIGFFVNTLVLRSKLSGNPTFRELLLQVREVALDAYAHQDLPFEKLVEELRLERSLSHNPLFQVMFVLQNAPEDKLQLPGLKLNGVPVRTSRSMFDITLYATEWERGLLTRMEYNTDLFDTITIERMQQHFQTLLEGIVANVEQPIAGLPLLTEPERQQVLLDFNRSDKAYSHEQCLHHLFQHQAELSPAAPALVFGEEQLSYQELNRRANQLAHYLQKRGVGLESRVGLYLERSPEMLVAILGVLKAGAAYVPLDPAYPKDRIAFIVEDAQLQLLLTQERLIEQLPTTSVQAIRVDAEWPSIASESADNPGLEVTPRNLAYVLYTSGSTGKPKGVQIEHGNVVNFLCSMRREPGLTADDVLLALTTLSFDIAGLELFLPLTVGARIVMATREQAIDGAQLLGLLEATRVTVMQATPATWSLLIEYGWTGKPDLKILCGGEALPRELAEQLLPRCAELWNMYGPTETTIWSSLFRVRDTNWTIAPIGRPIANTQMYVLDKYRRPLPIGVAGELYIGGNGVARAYWNRPELTVQKFVDDQFRSVPGARLYATGDQVRLLPDGNIQYIGRLDSQVKVRGYRIELGEVENTLTQHAAVQQTVVMVREDVPGDKRLVAYLILETEHSPSTGEWRSYLKQSLPDYMIPNDFVVLERFPLTPNGKVDRKALPVPDAPTETPNPSVAKDELEAMLVSIWKRVLGISSVGISDNFFELGGHSLLAVRLIAEIGKVTGREIPLATLFQGATIEYLAEVIRQGGSPPHQIVLPIQENGSEIPFFGIVTPGMNALGYIALARHLGPDQPLYRIQGPGVRMKGRSYSPAEFEALAVDYIKAMKTIQPHGPYYLGGMCEGARIAFDMARLLQAEKEEVAFLAIFDTWVLENSQNRFLWKIDYYSTRFRQFRRLSFQRKIRYLAGWFHRRAQTKATRNAQLGGIPWPEAFWPGKDFVPKKFDGQITVFKNPKQAYFYVRDPLMGWGTRTTIGVEVHDVNTKHGFFMREPYVQDLAAKLSECLHSLRGQTSEGKNRVSDEAAATELVLSGERFSS